MDMCVHMSHNLQVEAVVRGPARLFLNRCAVYSRGLRLEQRSRSWQGGAGKSRGNPKDNTVAVQEFRSTTMLKCLAPQCGGSKDSNTLHGNLSQKLLDHDQLFRSGSAHPMHSASNPQSAHQLSLSLRSEIFHVFISYRVKSESGLVGELYHKLLVSTDAAKIPDISKWPSKFKQPNRESRLHVFWDAKCLVPGLTWKDNGFVAALSSSLLFLPLLSDGLVEKWFAPVQDAVDNVLLELILALEFNLLSEKHPSEVYPCKHIVPVFVNDLSKRHSELSLAPANETMKEAARILAAFGLTPSRQYSPHCVLTALGAFQGVEMHVYHDKLRQQALDVVVHEAVTAVAMCIQASASFINDFVAHHPRAKELCDWLRSLNMSHYTGLMARHGINSVHCLSLVDASTVVPALAEDFARSCGQTRVQAIATLSRAIALVKSSPLRLPLCVRCNSFVDDDASILSAVYSSCGVDAILTKPLMLIVFLSFSFLLLVAAIFTIRIVEQPFLSVSIGLNPLFWLIMSATSFFLGTWPFAYGGSTLNIPSTTFKPRKVAATTAMFCACLSTAIVVYIKCGFFDSIALNHSILCQYSLRENRLEQGLLAVSFDTCFLYELIGIYLVQIIALCIVSATIYFKQEAASRALLGGLVIVCFSFLIFNEMLSLDNYALLRILGITAVTIGVILLIIFESTYWYSKKMASNIISDDEVEYNSKWSSLMIKTFDSGSSGHTEACALSAYISTHFRHVVDDLRVRCIGKRPHAIQEHSSIDMLFDDVECVDVAFQELLQCWLKGSSKQNLCSFVQEQDIDAFTICGLERMRTTCLPGPVKQITRAISKTNRSYRGDFRRLTDLVRSTIVFKSFSDIHNFLQLLCEHALCSSDDISQTLRRAREPSSGACEGQLVMQIIRIRNRFDPSASKHQLFGGYRDIALKIKMGFTFMPSSSNSGRVKFVPVSRWGDPHVKRLIFEIQLHLDGMQLDDAASSGKHHQIYVQCRNLLSV